MNIWHVPFHVIESEWTDDQFYSFIERAGERIKRENSGKNSGKSGKGVGDSVSGSSSTQNLVKRINAAKTRAQGSQVDGD
jgi:hypothetical protein